MIHTAMSLPFCHTPSILPRLAARVACLALATLATIAALGGCMGAAVVGGSAGAGTLLVNGDRRSSETAQADRTLESAAEKSLEAALAGRGHVNVTSYFQRLLLTGEVLSEADRQLAEQTVRAAASSAVSVHNELAVMAGSGVIDRSGDALITSKVKTRLLNQNGVPSRAIKVVTERGTTYLMGRLTAAEADLATEAARTTDGVQRVVRIFDLIAEQPAGGVDGVITPLGGQTTPAPLPAAMPAPGAIGAVQTHPVVQTPVVVQPSAAPLEVQTLPPAQ